MADGQDGRHLYADAVSVRKAYLAVWDAPSELGLTRPWHRVATLTHPLLEADLGRGRVVPRVGVVVGTHRGRVRDRAAAADLGAGQQRDRLSAADDLTDEGSVEVEGALGAEQRPVQHVANERG